MKLDNFTIKAQESVQKAFEIAESKGQQSVESSHLLKGIMTVAESVTDFLFGKLGTNIPMPRFQELIHICLLIFRMC